MPDEHDELSLWRVIYSSKASNHLGLPDIQNIVDVSQRLNALDGISGVLLFFGTSFVGYLEGGKDAISDIVNRIEADNRHESIIYHLDESTSDRKCHEWSMQLVGIESVTDSLKLKVLNQAWYKTNANIVSEISSHILGPRFISGIETRVEPSPAPSIPLDFRGQ